jgi:GNAT superfamily N-acetyltransferase
MKMKILSAPERHNFYHTYLIQDFHASEVKPFETIEKLVRQGKYICFGFFKDSEPLGYAFFTKSNDNQALLIDYFAVIKSHRSKGLGSKFLTEIKNTLYSKYATIIIEVEDPKFALDENNKSIRIRRIQFYLNNGFKTVNVLSSILTDEYLIMTFDLDKRLQDEIIFDELQEIYYTLFGKDFFNQNIHLRKSVIKKTNQSIK